MAPDDKAKASLTTPDARPLRPLPRKGGEEVSGQPISLYLQCEAVEHSLRSAEQTLADDRSIYSEGDWRTQKSLHRRDALAAAFKTLNELRTRGDSQ